MKVLVTGCSPAQTSESVSQKIPTFTGLMVKALTEAGHTVVWDTPTMRWDEAHLAQYDSVVVGLSAPTSITAHRLYGALSVIDVASKVTDVKYLIDAPEPHRLWNGIRAIAQNPDSLVKDFYSRRSEFDVAKTAGELERLQSVVENLYKNPWKSTIVPAFPWFKPEYVTNHIPNLSSESVSSLCLDLLTFKAMDDDGLYMKSDVSNWSCDVSSPWVSKIAKTLVREVSPLIVSKKSSTASVISNLNRSVGTLISVYKNEEPWWSVHLAQSLYVTTPVVTDWRYTSYLGESWSVLAHAVEDMPPSERASLARKQKKEYLSALGDYKETINRVSSVVLSK